MNYYVFTTGTGIISQPNSCYIYNKSTNIYSVLNRSSLDYISTFDGTIEKNEIIELISRRYKINPNKISLDLKGLIDFLLQKGFIDIYDKACEREIPFELSEKSHTVKLVDADIEITNYCNLHCLYCYAESNTIKDYRPAEFWINFLSNLHLKGLRSVTISGGEPFVHPEIKDIIDFCSKKFITTINTNGTLIDNYFAEWLSKLNLNVVQISLDSNDSIYHDSMRGNGTWDLAINAIKILRTYGVPVRISTTITEKNLSHINPLKMLSKELDSELKFETLKPGGYASKLNKNLFPKIDDTDLMKMEDMLISTFSQKCQAIIGFAAINCLGQIKPCNLPNTYFHKVAPKAILPQNLNKSYGKSEMFKIVDAACTADITLTESEKTMCLYEDCVIDQLRIKGV